MRSRPGRQRRPWSPEDHAEPPGAPARAPGRLCAPDARPAHRTDSQRRQLSAAFQPAASQAVTPARYLATIAPEPPDCDPLAEAEPDDDGEFWELDGEPDDGVPSLAEQIERQRR